MMPAPDVRRDRRRPLPMPPPLEETNTNGGANGRRHGKDRQRTVEACGRGGAKRCAAVDKRHFLKVSNMALKSRIDRRLLGLIALCTAGGSIVVLALFMRMKPSSEMRRPSEITTTLVSASNTKAKDRALVTSTSLPLLTVHRLPTFYQPMEDIPSSIPMTRLEETIDVDLDSKVMMYGLERHFSIWGIADFSKNVFNIYQHDEHHVPGGGIESASLTAKGDAVIVTSGSPIPHVSFFREADFSKQPILLHPSRFSNAHSTNNSSLDVITDRNNKSIWMLQLEYLEINGQQEVLETWVDLVNIYDGETVSTFVFQGRYTIGGVIDDGLVLTGNGRILILDHEGNSYSFEIELENPTGWQNGFRSIEAHGKHIALLTPDGQEMAIVDVESKTTTPVAKPGPGVWIPSRIPISLISSFSITQGDQFVIGFRSPTGDWSLHTISLTEQSSQQLGEYPGPKPVYPTQPLFWANSVTEDNLVLAFTGSLMNIVKDNGTLMPVVRFPKYFSILLDAA